VLNAGGSHHEPNKKSGQFFPKNPRSSSSEIIGVAAEQAKLLAKATTGSPYAIPSG